MVKVFAVSETTVVDLTGGTLVVELVVVTHQSSLPEEGEGLSSLGGGGRGVIISIVRL